MKKNHIFWLLLLFGLAMLLGVIYNSQRNQRDIHPKPDIAPTYPLATVSTVLETPAPLAQKEVGEVSVVDNLVIERGLSQLGQNCVSCHSNLNPGIINDWLGSRHSHVNVSCIDCHEVPEDSPLAVSHATTTVSILVPPERCARCHPVEAEQFAKSGHARPLSKRQPSPDNLHATIPITNAKWGAINCLQCHGTEIKLDKNRRPTADTWPNSGIANVYPDGSVGNCTVCHTRHAFNLAESRKPESCATCHFGSAVEVYNHSQHGHIYQTDGANWQWDLPPDGWEPGSYRAPTCVTCHLSGIGRLATTHNVSERLHWTLSAKEVVIRNSDDPLNPQFGDGIAGRKQMVIVCDACHISLHTNNYWAQGDGLVEYYQTTYFEPAQIMFTELQTQNKLKANPWADEFQITFYELWHDHGRRLKQGALMARLNYGQDLQAVQTTFAKLTALYEERLANQE